MVDRDNADIKASVVEAERFNLVDAAGNKRAILRVQDDDSVVLGLLDNQGRDRAALALQPDGSPGFYMLDDSGTIRASWVVTSRGDVEIQFHDGNNVTRVTVSLGPSGGAGLILSGENEQELASLLASSDVWGLTLSDQQKRVRAGLFHQGGGQASLNFMDEDGTILWSSLRP